MIRWLPLVVAAACAHPLARAQAPPVGLGPDGALVYRTSDRGDRLPDFSHCGYAGGDRPIPHVPARVAVAPAPGDDGARIQQALDYVATLPAAADGFRGAVLLAPGTFEVAGQLQLASSGVVLRGSGADEAGTTLLATGRDRRPLVAIAGPRPPAADPDSEAPITDAYVPVGARRLHVAGHRFRVGQAVVVRGPSTAELIRRLGADAFGVGWRPGSRDILWQRVVTAVDGDALTLDAPLTASIGARGDRPPGAAGTVRALRWPNRLADVGVEDVALQSEIASDNPHDEQHAWYGVTFDDVQDAWVRRVAFRRFAGGAVLVRHGARHVTAEDCASFEPTSELGGYRRLTFFTEGQQTLFLRCWSEHGLHDFATGHCTPGPTAFVNCRAEHAHGDSGPRESWSTGVLFDNVRVDGAGLNLTNRWAAPPGAGWTAANCLLWQCRAATMRVDSPPGAANWAVGVWADFAGDGEFHGRSDFAAPLSLFAAQLAERLGADEAAGRVGPILGAPIGATNPTIDEARQFVAQSRRPPRRLVDDVAANMKRGGERARGEASSAPPFASPAASAAKTDSADKRGPLRIANGWLTIDGRVVVGGRFSPTWWRGNIRPADAPTFGPAVTRFAPGRVGPGLTDDLAETADFLAAGRFATYDHHYGLWYDRRRDDHLMERRADGETAPPFYEQPFARTGRGRAWDGLSRYDLTRFNPWYWSRLDDFAELCDQRGLVLLNQNYFQHNILEAGAHWADCPWRPANNVNHTGLPEPPPLVGDKRIFMAPHFYDVGNAKLRALHRGYIRQCLDALARRSNVLQLTSAEYSGPREFVEFWIDVVAEWEAEHGRNVLTALSAPRNVQDAILSDARRAAHVDVIDIRYWAYTAGEEAYAPDGGLHLAPRQHLRMTRAKPGGAAAIARAVREYRRRFPDKPVLYNSDENCPSDRDGWAVLAAGGSLADVRLPPELAAALPAMAPLTDDELTHAVGVGRSGQAYLVYRWNAAAEPELRAPAGSYRLRWIDPQTGAAGPSQPLASSGTVRLPRGGAVAWLTRQ